MRDKKKKPKYYLVRAAVVWGTTVSIFVLLIVIFVGNKWIHNRRDKVVKQEDRPKTIEVTFDGMESELQDVEECYLCGNSNQSLMGYYRKFDTIGLISLNDWYVLDFPLKNYDGEGKEIVGKNTDNMTSGNTGEIMYSCDGTVSRGMAAIKVTLPEDYKLNTGTLTQNLCQVCLDKVTASLKYWKKENEKKEAIPLCLVDFDTLEIYPLQETYPAYFIRDYWIEMEFGENEMEVEAFYLPER